MIQPAEARLLSNRYKESNFKDVNLLRMSFFLTYPQPGPLNCAMKLAEDR